MTKPESSVANSACHKEIVSLAWTHSTCELARSTSLGPVLSIHPARLDSRCFTDRSALPFMQIALFCYANTLYSISANVQCHVNDREDACGQGNQNLSKWAEDRLVGPWTPIYYHIGHGSYWYSHETKFKDFSRTPNINFQGLNADISSYYYTLRDIIATVKLHAIKLKPH